MYKQAAWDVNLQTDNEPLPIKGEVKANISVTPETATILGAAGGGTLGYLLGPEHKGWRALTTLAGALVGGSGSWYAATKIASVDKTAKEKQYAPRGATSRTHIGGGQQSTKNPVTSVMRGFMRPRYAGDPTGQQQFQVSQDTFNNMSSAWQRYKASSSYISPDKKTPARGFIPTTQPAPSFIKPRQQ